MYTCVCVRGVVCVYTRIHVCICMCVHIHIYIYIHMYIHMYVYIYIYIGANTFSERRIEHDHGLLRTRKMAIMMLIMNFLIRLGEQNCQKSVGKRMIFNTCVYIFLLLGYMKKKKKSMRESAGFRPTRLIESAGFRPTRGTPPTPWISIEINRN